MMTIGAICIDDGIVGDRAAIIGFSFEIADSHQGKNTQWRMAEYEIG